MRGGGEKPREKGGEQREGVGGVGMQEKRVEVNNNSAGSQIHTCDFK